ncbi:MAG: ABC transporter permease [Candidatus Aminicenantes bacterium]|nr:ABC transporter permease [Candidatus Aminicenantes bacterium]
MKRPTSAPCRRPPRISEWLLKRLDPDRSGLSLVGDLTETFQIKIDNEGLSRARYWYRRQFIKALFPLIRDVVCWRINMLKNHFKIAFRHMSRQKGYTIINVLGLALGLACTLLILLWVKDEIRYDRFHENKDRIYRILSRGRDSEWYGLPSPLGPAAEEEIPEVEEAVRIYRVPRFIFSVEEKSFYEDKGITADTSFFRVFSFPVLRGNPVDAFDQPWTIVLTESLARKYFGDADSLGRTIRLEGQVDLKVVGVMADVPHNSHLQFDFVLPQRFAERAGLCGLEWGDFNFMTYLLVSKNADEQYLMKRLNETAEAHGCPQVVDGMVTFVIQAMPLIYLNPCGPYDIALGNKRYVILFSAIALFILFIGCINFINLSTARSEKRSREVGLRKVIGAGRKQLISQFFGESILLAFLSVFLAVFIARMMMPFFNRLTAKDIPLNVLSPLVLVCLFGLVLLVGFAAGFYPALYLSSFQPVHVLRAGFGAANQGTKGFKGFVMRGSLRRILVIAQFSLSIILILATVIVYFQLHYLQSKSWTLEEDQILYIPFRENIAPRYDVVRRRLLQHPDIIAVGAKDVVPTGLRNNTMGIGWEGKRADQKGVHMETTRVDEGYFEVMDISIVEGRGFSLEFPADKGRAFILNEEAVRVAEIENPVGKRFRLYGTIGTIVGVAENTYFQSMKEPLRAKVYYLFTNLPQESFGGVILIRVKGGKEAKKRMQGVIAHIEGIWNEMNNFAPFEYHFLDETVDAHYKTDRRLGRLFSTFAFLAVFISCLGLFGLASFVTERRTKEIGIRKVLGATYVNVVRMLSKDFIRWVLAANLIAWPVALYAMSRWLENFTYRTSIPWWIFPAAGLLALFIALLTVSLQTLKAALADPVRSLRHE